MRLSTAGRINFVGNTASIAGFMLYLVFQISDLMAKPYGQAGPGGTFYFVILVIIGFWLVSLFVSSGIRNFVTVDPFQIRATLAVAQWG